LDLKNENLGINYETLTDNRAKEMKLQKEERLRLQIEEKQVRIRKAEAILSR